MANAHFAVVFASEWCSREDGDLLSMLGEEGESGWGEADEGAAF